MWHTQHSTVGFIHPNIKNIRNLKFSNNSEKVHNTLFYFILQVDTSHKKGAQRRRIVFLIKGKEPLVCPFLQFYIIMFTWHKRTAILVSNWIHLFCLFFQFFFQQNGHSQSVRNYISERQNKQVELNIASFQVNTWSVLLFLCN